MQERNVTVTLEKAKEWYNSDNATLKEVALQAFSKEELDTFDFTKIKTFEDALDALGYCCSKIEIEKVLKGIRFYSKASAAMFQINIIRKALNKDYDLHLTKNAEGQNYTWYPYFKFVTKSLTYYDEKLKSGEYKKLGEITSEGVTYDVLSGGTSHVGYAGLGGFYSGGGVGHVDAFIGFLGCATEEIAQHFGEYFGMLIMETMYEDIIGLKYYFN